MTKSPFVTLAGGGYLIAENVHDALLGQVWSCRAARVSAQRADTASADGGPLTPS